MSPEKETKGPGNDANDSRASRSIHQLPNDATNLVASFQNVCERVFQAQLPKKTFPITSAERVLYGENESQRRILQAAVETELFSNIDFKSVNGQLASMRGNRFGFQAFADPLLGNLLKEMGDMSFANNFGVIPVLIKRLSTDSASDVQRAITAFTPDSKQNSVHKVIEASKFSSAKDEKYGNLIQHSILEYSFDDIKQGRLAVSIPQILDALQEYSQLLSKVEYDQIPWLKDLRQSVGLILKSPWITELQALVNEFPQEFIDTATPIQVKEAKEKLVNAFKNNQSTISDYSTTIRELVALTYLSRLHEGVPQILGLAKKAANASAGVNIKEARHLKATQVRTNLIGERMMFPYDEITLKDKPMLSTNKSHTVESEMLEKAATLIPAEEMPIDFEINHEKPIIVITGQNGVGKTHGMETVGQQILWSQLTGTADGSQELSMESLEPPSVLINTATTSSDVSTFEGEIYPFVRAINVSQSGKPRITFVDEIGRGTDSKDAVAIALATAAYSIQTNGYLVISTHYGHDLATIAKKIGLRNKMRIFAVDPKTHKLVEVDDPVDSKGIEVWKGRAKSLEKGLKEQFIKRATTLRTASASGSLTELTPWNLTEHEKNQSIQFVDQETLADLGLGIEPGNREVYNGILSLLPEGTTVLSDSFFRHLKLSIKFDQPILQMDRTMIGGLIEAAKKSNLSLKDILTRIANFSSLINTWSTIALTQNDSSRIKAFIAESGMYQMSKRLDLYDSAKMSETFLNTFGTLSRVRQLFSGENSARVQLEDVLIKNKELTQLIDQLHPDSLRDIYTEAYFSAFEKEAASMKKSFDLAMASSIENTNGWDQSHVNRAVELLGIPANTYPGALREILVKTWRSGDGEKQKKILTWALEADQTNTANNPIYSIIKSAPMKAILNLIDTSIQYNADVKKERPRGFDEDSKKWKEYVLDKLTQGDFEPIFALSRALRLSKGIEEGNSELRDFQKYIYSLDLLIPVEFQELLSKQFSKPRNEKPSVKDYQALLDRIAYAGVFANAIDNLSWSSAIESTDGSYQAEEAIPLEIIAKKKPNEIVRQSFVISPETNLVTINGYNGNGKTVLLRQMPTIPLMAELTGYVPAKKAVVPKYKFIRSMINAGKSTQEASSFQNEADRSIKFINDFASANYPEGGLILFDEPNASTSGGDQIGLTLSTISLLTNRKNLVAITNHNSQLFSVLNMLNEQQPINFQTLAFPFDPERPFRMIEVAPNEAADIQSGGIDKAESMGLDPAIIEIARFIRSIN